MKTRFHAIALLAAIILCTVGAKADTVTVFNAAGTFADGATLSGTLTINTTSGAVTAADLMVSAPDSITFDLVPYPDEPQQNGPDSSFLPVATSVSVSDLLEFTFPVLDFTGYRGGSITGTLFTSSSPQPIDLPSGQFTPGSSTTTPEIPTFAMIGIGLLLLTLGLRRRRHTKEA